MPKAHRHDDLRICGATTIVSGQSDVTIEGKLWSVEGDPNSHGGGALIATHSDITINKKKVIVVEPDHASADGLCPIVGPPHCDPQTATGAADVTGY